MLNFGHSSVVLPVYATSIMRESPLARHGLSLVPGRVEPLGQSSLLLGVSALGVGGGAATAAAALGLAGAASFLAASSQPNSRGASTRAVRSFVDGVASDMVPFSFARWRKCGDA